MGRVRALAWAATGLLLAAGGCDRGAMAQADSTPAPATGPTTDTPHESGTLPEPPGGNWPFDFWVLALSWSPTHCGADGMAARDPQQCAGPRPYGFVVHGLWPQFERGFPRSCPARARGPDRSLTDAMLDIMPSRRLVAIQWERHGTCSGLDAEDYFALTRAARTRVAIPDAFTAPQTWQLMETGAVEAAFIAANPGLDPTEIAVEARGNQLREVRLCLDLELAWRACPEVDRAGEPAGRSLRIPPQRVAARSNSDN